MQKMDKNTKMKDNEQKMEKLHILEKILQKFAHKNVSV